jgi:Ni/Fe-hydrogenase subunit HybB-like protein
VIASPRTIIKDILWLVVAAGIVAVILRFLLGLGSTTGLNDTTPWGLWIAFKLCFVAIAGGGFTLAAMVYLFHLETYRPILRRAILIAFLGYGSFIVSLILDLGLPWHIYMPIISWQHHSVMFEIAWCVMLYFSVLALEFGPVILEHPWFQHPWLQVFYRLLRKSTVILVIAGVVLSTLHQSSLGALFLIMPHRIHPLWYSPWIPVLFFISAIAAGLCALILESHTAQKLFGRGLHPELLVKLGKVAAFTLWLYLALRLGDLFVRGVLPGALDGSWQSLLFVVEIVVGGLLPAILLSIPKIRNRSDGLITSAILALGGILSQRMALSLFTMQRPQGMAYTPSMLEIIIAFAIPSAAALIYFLFNEQLAVIDSTPSVKSEGRQPSTRFEPMTRVVIKENWYANLLRRSGLAVLVVAFMIAVLPAQIVTGQSAPSHPVKAALGWENLLIDGNGSGYAVLFPHAEHQKRQIEIYGDTDQACKVCHHIQYPNDQATACSKCHQDYYQPVSIFNHIQHQQALGNNASCKECHPQEHSRYNTTACQQCHEDMLSRSREPISNPALASGYLDAMHIMCRDCHQKEAGLRNKPGLDECITCHGIMPEEEPTSQVQ